MQKKTPRGASGTSDNSKKNGIYISEHLTKNVANLYFEARQLAREKKLMAVWTNKGLVNAKFTNDPNEKPTVLRNLGDIYKPRNGLHLA